MLFSKASPITQATLSLKGLLSFSIIKCLIELFEIIFANLSPKLSVNFFDLICNIPRKELFFSNAFNNSSKFSTVSISKYNEFGSLPLISKGILFSANI